MKYCENYQNMTQRHEVRKCCRKNGANVLVWYSIAINVQFVKKKKKKALTVKHRKNRDACISGCSHTQINPYQDTGEYSICEEIWMFPGYQLYWNWSNLQTGTFVCRLWVNGPRSIGAPRALHDHTTVNSKLQWGELKKKKMGNFPGSPVVKILHFQYRGMNSVPGQKTKIPHAAWPQAPQKKKTTQRNPDSGYS